MGTRVFFVTFCEKKTARSRVGLSSFEWDDVRVLYSTEPTLSGLFLFFTKVYIGGG